jgi:hypothetical protein
MKCERVVIYYDPVIRKWFKVTYFRGGVEVKELVVGE